MPDPDQNPEQPPHKPDGWEIFCDGILATEFGRRQSDSLARAIALLSDEEMKTGWRKRLALWWGMLRPLPRFAFATACVTVIALSGWLLVSMTLADRRPPIASVCMITAQVDAHWARGARMGDTLPTGDLRLESGVVQLTFNSHARVAIEGPAEFRLVGRNAMELLSGRMSAEVPKPAHGFTVKFGKTRVVDLGTRFGVDYVSGAGKVDVFEGKVLLVPDAVEKVQHIVTQGMAMDVDDRGDATAATYSETAYPRMSVMLAVHPVNCSFDGPGEMEQGGVPGHSGYWSGWAYDMVRAQKGITPLQGRGMLRFLSPSTRIVSDDSAVWQVIDLRTNKAIITRGGITVTLSAYFDRVRGEEHAAKVFGLAMAAFHGRPENVENLWMHRNELALATADKQIVTDDDPATWEKLDVSTALPSEADFLVVEMRAIAPDDQVRGTNPFPGHFADLIDCSLTGPLQASSAR